MFEIPIFDSLTHPMPNGNWTLEKYKGKNTIDSLIKSMRTENIKWAFAVGMGENIGNYNEDIYSNFIRLKAKNIFPVAFLNVRKLKTFSEKMLIKYFGDLVNKGYVGVKFHPRIGKFSFNDEYIPKLINLASKQKLVVLLCTYIWSNLNSKTYINTSSLIEVLKKTQEAKIILLHGGVIKLLEYIEISRVFSNLLLDLSFTMCKYRKSSIDLDIRYAFNQFDERICIGSDYPEFSLKDLRNSFNFFSRDISKNKLENIAFRNIINFVPLIKIKLDE